MTAAIGRGLKRVWWRRSLILFIPFALFWLGYMPVHPYRPACESPADGSESTYFSPKMSAPFIRSMKKNMDRNGMPYFHIGAYVFVPLNTWTMYGDEFEGSSWFDHAFFGWTAGMWRKFHYGVASWAAEIYVNELNDPEIMRLKTDYQATWSINRKPGDPEYGDEEERRRFCALVEAAARVRE